MKKKIGFIFALALMAINVAIIDHKQVEVVDAAYSTNATTYYSSITNESGDALLEKLATLSKTNHRYYNTYEECRTMCAKSDQDPNNSSNFIDFYSGLSMPGTWNSSVWNREHVWCQSLSGGMYTKIAESDKGAGADIHHIRPLIDNINSSRNDNVYGEVANRNSYKKYYDLSKDSAASSVTSGTLFGYINGGVFEPRDSDKGDVARILMYMYMHYSKEVSANSSHSYAGSLSITNITSASTSSAAWDMLVDWSNSDPVSTLESNRNNYCAGVTGVRNPFVDHPEYANYIWGGQTNTGGSSSGGNTGSGDNTDSGDNSGSSGSDSTGGETIVIPGTSTTSTVYRKLSSANGITAGSKIIIVAADYDRALSTNQNPSARGYTTISKYTSGSSYYVTPSNATGIFTVGGSSGEWTLQDTTGYIASASSSVNELQTKSSASSNNATWKINFSSGNANIIANGSYTHNVLRYSTSSGFTCYKPASDGTVAGNPVCIYKQYTETTSTPDQTITLPSANSTLTISKANEVASLVGSSYTPSKYKITGKISSIDNTTYGNMYVQDTSGNSLYVYGTYADDGATRYDAIPSMHKPQVGDTITLYGVLGTYNSYPQMKNSWIVDLEKGSSSSSELQSLFETYTGDGTYTKKSVINLNSEAIADINQYFHAGSGTLTRTTYYNGNALLMANYDGTLKGLDATTGINSGYGTDSNGNMTHFRINSDGSKTIDYTVEIANGGGMEEFYVTPNDFATSNYFSSGWEYVYGQGYVHNISTSSTSKQYLSDFIAVAAPLLLDKIYQTNYVQIEKLVIKEVNGTIVMQIIVSSTNSGALSNLVSEANVLSESVITSDMNCNYSF